MSELRQDRTTGQWVIIAPDRSARPGAPHRKVPAVAPAPEFDPACPFCPGNEALLPGILAESETGGDPQWATRVVPNKYPALRPDGGAATAAGIAAGNGARQGFGHHEVIIESPRHNADPASMSDGEIVDAAFAYRERLRHVLTRPGIEAVVLFRNRGSLGGASLAHPHAQVIALGLVPPVLAMLAEYGQAHYRAHGHCATCDAIAAESKASVRVVEETPDFLAYVPFAAARPGEIWIAPKRHQASLTEIGDLDLREFARLLRRSLARLKQAFDDPAYNFVFDSADRTHLGAPYFHWRLRIVPQLWTWGGFELGTGIAINPSAPEDDAARFRATVIE